MPLRVYDPIRRTKVPFVPVTPGRVGMYVCGMTVQGEPHLGHMLAALTGDLVRRYLEFSGFAVTLVQNFTDIDDKILARAAEEGLPYTAIAQRNIDLYLEQARALNIQDATVFPRATAHIPEMLALIEALIARGHAYAAEDAVYFDVRSYSDYGRLSGRRVDELYSGVRVDVAEGKRDELDFALWKKAPREEPGFESPWGWGRPGWHIECSAMSTKYCGQTLDFHGGGLDLKFPHHENERAQSEAASGTPFVNFWLHNGLVTVGGEKMSKSLGNYTSVAELLETWDPEVIRFYLLSTHFRSRAEFETGQLERAKGGLERIRECSLGLNERLAAAPLSLEASSPASQALAAAAAQALERWREAMDDDFNSGGAIGHLFELVREFNRLVDEDDPGLRADRAALTAARDALATMTGVLGLFREGLPTQRRLEIPAELTALLAERDAARAARNWAEADRLRGVIQAAGYQVLDGPEGSRLRPL
jgi:cysteinyl-tRNA synthetase